MRRVVLLPGLDGTGALFEPFLRAAPAGEHLEVVPIPRRALGYVELTESLAPQVRPASDTILVAESFSGPIAIKLAARSPLAALILCNSFVTPPRPRALAALARPLLFAIRPPDALLRRYFRYFLGHNASGVQLTELRAAVAATPPPVLADRLRRVLRVDVVDELGRIRLPVLYLRGTGDRLVPERSVAAIQAARSAPLVVSRIPGPHLLLQTAPEACWRAIGDFLSGLSS
jgi:pimeloyl-ACP methyl ester carboxylesterase